MDKLEKIIESNMKTIMIGSIAAIEKRFGFLFGQDKKDITEEELELKRIFLKLRKDILDLGNKQINDTKKELEGYEVTGPKYRYEWRKDV